ncbi:protein FAM184A-like [Patiria miniata]|uniref:Protein FAM184A/B N-terminal domain-containing protein n=1 Tax=Patiria miniata TaxID=46514 RepID=A0A913Z3H3_PATMI|nr:protein FAM184A-like [Patiria miniata]
MATKMSFGNPFQQNKVGAGAASGQASADVTPELHLKMSKKIAQLTKVIYALNTKNDEHEAVVQNLKETHEEELQQLVTRTKDKIASYQSRIGQEAELRQKIQSLETTIKEEEKHKHEALAEFTEFKRKEEQRQASLKADHSQTVLGLSQDLLAIKRNFEDRLQQFEDTKRRGELERTNALTELRRAHTEEVETLKKQLQSEHSGLTKERQELIEQYESEIKNLYNQNNELKNEKRQTVEDYEAKLSKAQAFYERELAALRDGELRKNVEEWKEREAALRRQTAEKQHELETQIENVSMQLAVCEEDLECYKDKLTKAQSELAARESDSGSLSKQLVEAKQDSSQAITRLKQVEGELAASRERCQDQATDLIKKSSQIGTLEATRLSNESTMKDLRSSLAKLEDKLQWMGKERDSLENSKRSLSDKQHGQLKSLEKALEELSIEKQVMKERYEKELESTKTSSKEERDRLTRDHEALIRKIQGEHKEARELAARTAAQDLASLRQELERNLEETTQRLSQQCDAVQSQLDQTREELTNRLQSAEAECQRLQAILDENKQGLGSANSEIGSLSQANVGLKAELDGIQKELREAKNMGLMYRTELDRLKQTHESKMAEAKEELKTKLDRLSKDLDQRWTETLRRECDKLQSELTEQHSGDKRAALKQLALMKEQELEASRTGWENKLKDLLQEMSQLREALHSKAEQAQKEVVTVQGLADQKLNKLKFEMAAAAEEHARALSLLRAEKEKEVERLRREKDAAVQELEERLARQHREDMEEQLKSHRAEMEALQEEAERSRQSGLHSKSTEHKQAIERMKLELTQRHIAEMDQLSRAHRTQMAAAKMELERSIEIKQQQERDHKSREQELKEDVRQRDRHIDSVEKQLAEVNQEIHKLSNQLEFKGQEVLKVKSEAEEQLRRQEQRLAEAHDRDMDTQAAEHLRETQSMLGEFNRAQELLKDKISALQIMLEEAEDRYQSRESRPEDLEHIARLKETLSEHEVIMQKLVDEKRYFQLELINRETNFNKVFNTNPNVGVLNPFAHKKKKSIEVTREAPRYVSAPSLNTMAVNGSASSGGSPSHQRLDPLPDSPIHDIQLNPKKPLQMPRPPRTKKFINT